MLGRVIGVVVVAAAFFVSSAAAAFATADERATVTTSANRVPEEGADFTQTFAVTNDGPDPGSYHFHLEVEPLPWTSFDLTQGSSGTIPVGSVQIDPAHHTIDFDIDDVASGDAKPVPVTITPSNRTAETGRVTVSAQAPTDPVASNDSATGTTTITGLTVFGGAFADQLLGTTSAPQQVTVTNGSAQSVTLTGRVAGGNSADFGFGGFGKCAGAALAANASCSFETTFAPTAAGFRSATATLTPNSGPVDPVSFALAGHGTAPASAPVVALSGLPRTIRLKTLEKKGLSYSESANEASAFQNTLIGSAKKVMLRRPITAAKAFDVILAQSARPLGVGRRTVHLKPSRKLIVDAKRFRLRLRVVATDASGNQSVVIRTIKVR